MKNQTVAGIALTLALTSTAAFAQVGYGLDTSGQHVLTGFGDCLRTNYWTQATETVACNPALAKKPAPVAVSKTTAVPAAPAPVTAIAVPLVSAPMGKKLSFTLKSDFSFEFNKAVLTAEAKETLNTEIVAKLGDQAEISQIIINGHTDRLGSQAYNQKLSERRAMAVSDYLVSQGVAAEKIETMGMGKTQPLPEVKCANNQPRRALIECLAPNRRVVVDVMGKK